MKRHVRFVPLFVLLFAMVFGVSSFSQDFTTSVNIPLTTYFARVQANPYYQLVNLASVDFAEKNLKGTDYENLPIISRSSTIDAGFRGADNFADVPAGPITSEEMQHLYRYANKISALKLNGKQVIEWLEASAGNFFQIDPEVTDDQILVNFGFDCHHFDQFWGITYIYDVTKPLGSRVARAEYKGVPLSEDMEFIVMVDSYRASGGGGLPHAVPENVVLEWDVDYKTMVFEYLDSLGGIMPELVISWSIKPVETAGRVLFKTGGEWGTPVLEYMEVAEELGIEQVDHISYVGTDDVWGLFEIDLSKVKTPQF